MKIGQEIGRQKKPPAEARGHEEGIFYLGTLRPQVHYGTASDQARDIGLAT